MTRFSDAALLTGDFSHMAKEFRAGTRTAPGNKDWQKTACETSAEAAAQEVAKHIFALQKGVDEKTQKLEVMAFTAAGPMKVLNLVPGETDILRLDGVTHEGNPVAQVLHASQLALTFSIAPLQDKDENDDGLDIGFVIFEELKERKKKRTKKSRKLSLSTSRKIKPSPKKTNAGKTAPQKKVPAK